MPREAIFEASVRYFLEPIVPLLDDPTVTEIMVNGYDEIYVERRGKLVRTDLCFANEDALLSAVHNVAQWVGREIHEGHPVLDARLPSGARVHAVIPPSARTGIYLTIRKFSAEALTMDDLILFGTISEMAAEFLDLCIRLRKNILVSGGTGTGKTVTLGALSQSIPADERIVVIEDTSELRLIQPHSLYLEAAHAGRSGAEGLNVRQLFVNSLRMRPDRIIVGEVRGGEALDLIQSMISGHAGSLSTIHASSALDALMRLETLSLMSDVDLPVYVARAQVASAIHLVVQIARFSEDGSRRVTRISECTGLDEQNRYRTQDIFALRLDGKTAEGRLTGGLVPTGLRPSFAQQAVEGGMMDRVRLTRELWSPADAPVRG